MLELLSHLKKVLLCFNKSLLMQTIKIADWTDDLRRGSFYRDERKRLKEEVWLWEDPSDTETSYLCEALRQELIPPPPPKNKE